MNAMQVLSEAGIQAFIEPLGGVRLKGLSKLHGEKKKKIIEFANNHKSSILEALADLPNPDLPPTCPFNSGGYAPAGCRFAHDLLMNLIVAGVMPDPEVGCVFKDVCGELPDRQKLAAAPAPPAPENDRISCDTCPAYDPALERCYGIAFFKHKSGPWYSGQEAQARCPRKGKKP